MLIDLDNEQIAEVTKMFDELAITNIALVQVQCYGSDDSGSIESPDFYDVDKKLVTPVHTVIVRQFAEFSETLIDATGVDYYNNDGGSGVVTFDVKARTVQVVMGQNETVSTEVYSQTFDLG